MKDQIPAHCVQNSLSNIDQIQSDYHNTFAQNSRSAALIFHSTEIKKDITECSNVSCYLIYKHVCDSR